MSDYEQKHPYREYERRRHSIFFPLLLLTIGAFLLLNNLGYIQGDTGSVLMHLWPLIFVLCGLDGLIMGKGFVGSILMMGVGSLFLLVNLGYQIVDYWSILRFWPILLIAWGLDVIIGRRSIFSALVGIVVGLSLVAGLGWLVLNTPSPNRDISNRQMETFEQNLQNARSANLHISTIMGWLQLSGGTAPANILEGETYTSTADAYQQNYEVQRGNGNYKLDNKGGPFWIFSPDKGVRLKINSKIPLDLSIDMAVGDQIIDLSDLKNLEAFTSNLAIGRTVITLPQLDNFIGKSTLAVGDMTIIVPRDAQVEIEANTAITNINIPDNYEQDHKIIRPITRGQGERIQLKIDHPVGTLTVRYAKPATR